MKLTRALLPAALAIALVGSIVEAAVASPAEPLYVLLDAEALNWPAEPVEVVFELRDRERVLRTERTVLRFDSETALVPVPALDAVDWSARDLRLLVFAGGLLVQEFDAGSLLTADRVLRYTHAAEIDDFARSLAHGAGKPDTGNIDCGSPCGGGCLPHQDYDCDGVNNSTDNCTDDPNSNQANCDGDPYGDVCDFLDGIFQPTGPVKTCMTDKDNHVTYVTWEHHVEQRLVDVSSCGSPDRWNRWIRSYGHCDPVSSDSYCCTNDIGTSIQQVGDSVSLWCGSQRNQDYCQ